MSSYLKESLLQELCEDLSKEEINRLTAIIRSKVMDGYTASQIGVQLVVAVCETIHIAYPELDANDVVDLAEIVSDALIDRVLDQEGITITEQEIPYEQLN